MSSSTIFHAIGDFLTWTLGIFDVIGNTFNYAVIVLGFVGLFYWLNLQRKFNAQAENDPNQLK
jgi:hypothetical protein